MKRRVSIAVVAAIALGTAGSYVAQANPDNAIKLPKPLFQNFSGETKEFRRLMAIEGREARADLKFELSQYRKGAIDWFQALDGTSFRTFLYFSNVAFYSQQVKSRMGSALQAEMFAAAGTNETYLGSHVNDLTYAMNKSMASIERTIAGKDRGMERQCNANFRTVNRGEDMEAVLVWNGNGTCSYPTPNAVSGSYFYQDTNPRFCFVSVIPSSPSFSTVLACGYGVPGNSVGCNISGPLGGGSCSGFANGTTGIFFASGSVSGQGNLSCQMEVNNVTCAQTSLSVGCAPEFSLPLDR